MANANILKIFHSYELYHDEGGETRDEDGDLISIDPQCLKYLLLYDEYEFCLDISKQLYTLRKKTLDITHKDSNQEFSNDEKKRKDYLIELNKEQYQLLESKLQRWEKAITSDPESEIHKRRIRFLQTVRGELKKWFEENGIDLKSEHDSMQRDVNILEPKRKFRNGELRPLLEKIVKDIGLIKGKRPSKNEFERILDELKKMPFFINKQSIRTVLRRMDYYEERNR